MLVTSRPPRPGAARAIPLVIEGVDGPRGQALSRLLANHPQARVALGLRRDGGVAVGPTSDGADDARVVFSCDPGERSARRVRAWLAAGLRVVDLSGSTQGLEAALGPHDPRLVCGLPGLARRELRDASLVVAPGPLVTAATLLLAPAAQAGSLRESVELELEHADADRLERASSSEEVELQLVRLGREVPSLRVFLIPRRRPGAGLRLRAALEPGSTPAARLRALYRTWYADAPEVRVLDPDVNPEARPGQALLAVVDREDHVEVSCLLDERGRSPAQQALRCMNVMTGLPAELGLDV